jgi:hypothetical protein
MRRHAIITLAACLVLGLAGAANAARVAPPPPPPGPTPSKPGPVVCVALCPPPVALADTPNFKGCGDKLASLPRVTVGDIKAVDKRDRVHLVPLCDVVNRSLTAEQKTVLSRGNVQGLLKAIGNNPTLRAGLSRSHYAANDVIGVALGQHMVVLYVNHR